MRALLQRTTRAEVRVGDRVAGAIGRGLVVLLGVSPADDGSGVGRLAERTARLRIFPDEAGRFDRSVLDVGGGVLVVPQFTLYGDTSRGNRPSMTGAARPEQAEPLYEAFCAALARLGVDPVERGVFGAAMQVELVNDGPVTFLLEG
jgi:D-tyrosyl-tRNA(Tyr) deacylase